SAASASRTTSARATWHSASCRRRRPAKCRSTCCASASGRAMRSGSTDRVRSLAEAVALIPPGARVALGGNTFHRAPAAAVHELVRQRTPVELIKTAGAYEVDLLVGAGLVERVQAAYVGFET